MKAYIILIQKIAKHRVRFKLHLQCRNVYAEKA